MNKWKWSINENLEKYSETEKKLIGFFGIKVPIHFFGITKYDKGIESNRFFQSFMAKRIKEIHALLLSGKEIPPSVAKFMIQNEYENIDHGVISREISHMAMAAGSFGYVIAYMFKEFHDNPETLIEN